MKRGKEAVVSKKIELQAEIRNKLTMPLTVLNSFLAGENVSKRNIELAIKNIKEILKLIEEM